MKSSSICFLICVMFLLALPESSSSYHARGQNLNSLAGEWTLTAVSDPTGRDITFWPQGRGLVGTYKTSGGTEKPITNARIIRGHYYFDVPDLGLYFAMRFVRGRFEGKLTAYSTTEKKAPQPVRMVRRS
jgi:hypothetical protein